MKSVLIAGYPYIKESYFKTFNYYPEKDRIFFVLPWLWKAKGGKLRFVPPEAENIIKTNAYFYHSNYPIVGGLLKGLMPALPLILFRIRNKIDTVYSPSEPILLTTFYQGLCAKIYGKKHVFFTWENIPYENKFRGLNLLFKKIILRTNIFFSDGIICGNRKALEIIKKYTKKPAALIPLSGVDTDFFKRQPELKRPESLEGKVVFNFSGAIGFRKGIGHILRAFKKVLVQIPHAHLLLVGSGEYENETAKIIEGLGLDGSLMVIPWLNREDLKRTFNSSDIFLYPSLSFEGWEEQFGYSMAEASLMELPVISTKTGSISEVVLDGVTGLLVDPGNEEMLSEAMIKLGTDGGLRKQMGIAGRNFIEENYSYSAIAVKFKDFFEKL